MPVICAEMLVGFKLISEWRYVLRGSFVPAVDFCTSSVLVSVAVAAVGAIIELVVLVSWVRMRRSVTVVIVIVSTT